MTNEITLTYFIEPISVNKLYVNLRGQARRFLSTEGKKFKTEVEAATLNQLQTDETKQYLNALVGKPMTVSAIIGLPTWVLKNKKSVRKKDLDNKLKCLLDSIFTVFQQELNPEFDDSYIWQIVLAKKVTATPEVLLTISEYKNPM